MIRPPRRNYDLRPIKKVSNVAIPIEVQNIVSQETTATDNGQKELVDIVRDDIYGEVRIEDLYGKIIATPEFKRLKNIGQLGATPFVYPNANHSRYEHCIGTMHVANNLITNLEKFQREEICFEKHILIAGLCHDLGHGPYSHTFDNHFLQIRFPELNWTHEQCSVDLFEHLVDANYIDGLSKEDIELIQDLIVSSIHSYYIMYNKLSNLSL